MFTTVTELFVSDEKIAELDDELTKANDLLKSKHTCRSSSAYFYFTTFICFLYVVSSDH